MASNGKNSLAELEAEVQWLEANATTDNHEAYVERLATVSWRLLEVATAPGVNLTVAVPLFKRVLDISERPQASNVHSTTATDLIAEIEWLKKNVETADRDVVAERVSRGHQLVTALEANKSVSIATFLSLKSQFGHLLKIYIDRLCQDPVLAAHAATIGKSNQ